MVLNATKPTGQYTDVASDMIDCFPLDCPMEKTASNICLKNNIFSHLSNMKKEVWTKLGHQWQFTGRGNIYTNKYLGNSKMVANISLI